MLKKFGKSALAVLSSVLLSLKPRRMDRWLIIRDRPNTFESITASSLCVSLVFAAWYFLTRGPVEGRVIDPVTMPSPGETLSTLSSLWFERGVSLGAMYSLIRVIGGFLLAAAIGVPLGITAGSFRRLYAFLNPLSVFGRNIPVAALIPLTLMWFGLGEIQKVMFIFCAAVAFVFFDTVNAVDNVANNYLDSAYTLGAHNVPKLGTRWALVAGTMYAFLFVLAYFMLTGIPDADEICVTCRCGVEVMVTGFMIGFILWFPILSCQAIGKVLLPLALPDIANSLRLLFGLAFGYIMLAEVINAEYGLGAIINLSQRQGPREHIFLCLIFIALMAYGIDRVMLALQRWLFPYKQTGGH